MRKNQISIKIERFGDQSPDGKHQVIEVYADSNNIWEALTKANNLVADAITKTSPASLGTSSISIK